MSEATHPIPDGLQGVVMPSEIDGRQVTIALARRGEHAVEAILRDGQYECRAKADVLLDGSLLSMDALTGSLISQWREWRKTVDPDIWEIMRGET